MENDNNNNNATYFIKLAKDTLSYEIRICYLVKIYSKLLLQIVSYENAVI
jgi:hypothetical protein